MTSWTNIYSDGGSYTYSTRELAERMNKLCEKIGRQRVNCYQSGQRQLVQGEGPGEITARAAADLPSIREQRISEVEHFVQRALALDSIKSLPSLAQLNDDDLSTLVAAVLCVEEF